MLALAAIPVAASAQSYYDDDIYYDASKASKPAQTVKKVQKQAPAVVVADYPSADTYATSFTGSRRISVDDYNRRGIFATDSLTSDTTATDFQYTRRIEQFYNPEIIEASGDPELANIYYMQPEEVNIYVNTPSSYWGYDYFYPYYGVGYNPYWSYNPWRWSSSWYWNSWYDPFWNWGPGWGYAWSWGPGWGPSWGWGPGWGWGAGWGPSWGWSRPYNPRHPGVHGSRPITPGVAPGVGSSRPGLINGGRHSGVSASRYPSAISGSRPGVSNSSGYYRPSSTNGSRPGITNSGYSRPSNSNTGTYTRPSTNSNTNGGRYNSGSWGGSSRGSGYSGGSHSSGGGRSSSGGRGRH